MIKCGLTESGEGDSIQRDQLPQCQRCIAQIDSENTSAEFHTNANTTTVLPTCCLPVEGGHSADSQQQVEQTLGGVRQAVVLLQQVGQSGEVLARQHVHHHYVPHGEARQKAVTVQTHHPKSAMWQFQPEHKHLHWGRGFIFVIDVCLCPPEAFVHSHRNISGGPDRRRNVLEVSHVVHLDTGFPPVRGLETLCTQTITFSMWHHPWMTFSLVTHCSSLQRISPTAGSDPDSGPVPDAAAWEEVCLWWHHHLRCPIHQEAATPSPLTV